MEAADSLKVLQLSMCLDKIEKDKYTMENLNSSLENTKSKNKTLRKWTIGGFSVSAGLLILLLIK